MSLEMIKDLMKDPLGLNKCSYKRKDTRDTQRGSLMKMEARYEVIHIAWNRFYLSLWKEVNLPMPCSLSSRLQEE